MKKDKSSSSATTPKRKQSKTKSANTPLKSSQLIKLFVDELKDIYWA